MKTLKTLWNRPLVLLALLALAGITASACGTILPPTPQASTAPTNGKANAVANAIARPTPSIIEKWDANAFTMFGNSPFTLTLFITLGEKGENVHLGEVWTPF